MTKDLNQNRDMSPDDPTLPSSWPELRDGRLRLVLDTRLYRLEAIQKAAYRFADRFSTAFSEGRDSTVVLDLDFRTNTSASDAANKLRAFYQELLDQELREKVGDQTRALRALIMAQAFSRTDLINRDS